MPASARIILFVLLSAILTAGASLAQERPTPPRVAIDDGGSALALESWPVLPFPRAVRVSGELGTIESRVAALTARRIPVWLAVSAPSTVDAVEPWRGALQALLALVRVRASDPFHHC